jgi:hypothetical protein
VRPEFHELAADGAPAIEAGHPVVDEKAEKRGWFFAFSRTAFGLVSARTDGANACWCTPTAAEQTPRRPTPLVRMKRARPFPSRYAECEAEPRG